MIHETKPTTEHNLTDSHDDSCVDYGHSTSLGRIPLGGVNIQVRVGEGEEVEKQGEGASEGGARCVICDRSFGTKQGLGVHMAAKHREVTDQATKADHNSRRLVRWTPAELLDLAEKEALLMKKGTRFMNEALFPLCLGRSLEAIKGQRRKTAYKELVEAELAKLVKEGLRIAGDEGEGASVEGEEGRGEGQGPSRSGPASGTLDMTQGLLNQRMELERQNDRQNPLLGTEGRGTGLAHLRRDALSEGQ